MFKEEIKVSGASGPVNVLTSSLSEMDDGFLSLFRSSLRKARRGRNSLNFTEKRFPLREQTALSLTLREGRCVAFSSIWNRKSFWGESVYRVANRTWYDPFYRVKTLSRKTPNIFIIKTMIHQQLRYIEDTSEKYIAFISREGDKRKYLKWFSNKVLAPFYVHDDLCLVCSDRDSFSCWHTVASLSKGGKPFPFKKRRQRWKSVGEQPA